MSFRSYTRARPVVAVIKLALALAATPFVLWACNSHELAVPTPALDEQTNNYYETHLSRDLDLLFMIDNSGSTENKQRNFAQNFPVFIDRLRQIPGGLPNVRIGVVTSDLGAGGASTDNGCMGKGDGARFQVTDLQTGANCGITDGAQYISASNNGGTSNLGAGLTIEGVFSCMATRGAKGCGFEHQLKAVDRALNPTPDWNPMNAGFIRSSAFLGIVMLTDEDDCSGPDDAQATYTMPPAGWAPNSLCAVRGHLCGGMPPTGTGFSAPLLSCAANPKPDGLLAVNDIVDHVKALKPGHEDKIIVAAIAGWPPPGQEATAHYTIGRANGGAEIQQVCKQAGGGTPALRIKTFLESFENHRLETVCQDNFGGAMAAIADLVRAVVGDPSCFSAPLVDVDPKTPDVQPDCVVSDRPADAMDASQDVAIPACTPGGPRPCWSVAASPTCAASGHRIDVDRNGATQPDGTVLAVRCATCTNPNDPRCKS